MHRAARAGGHACVSVRGLRGSSIVRRAMLGAQLFRPRETPGEPQSQCPLTAGPAHSSLTLQQTGTGTSTRADTLSASPRGGTFVSQIQIIKVPMCGVGRERKRETSHNSILHLRPVQRSCV